MEVRYLDHRPEEFIRGLELSTYLKILRVVDMLERFGNGLGMPYSKHINGRLFELRVRGKQEVRLFYAFHGGSAVVVHGFIKKSDQIPERELKTAHARLAVLDGL